MTTHSSILAWKIPWTEKLGRLQSTELQRVRYDWETEHNNLLHLRVPNTSLGYYLYFYMTTYRPDVPVTPFSVSVNSVEQFTKFREIFYSQVCCAC